MLLIFWSFVLQIMTFSLLYITWGRAYVHVLHSYLVC